MSLTDGGGSFLGGKSARGLGYDISSLSCCLSYLGEEAWTGSPFPRACGNLSGRV